MSNETELRFGRLYEVKDRRKLHVLLDVGDEGQSDFFGLQIIQREPLVIASLPGTMGLQHVLRFLEEPDLTLEQVKAGMLRHLKIASFTARLEQSLNECARKPARRLE